MDYYQILSDAEAYVRSSFEQHHDKRYVYHNLHHTEQVVQDVKEISRHFQLNDEDSFVVVSAAWFHDVGYFEDAAHHEQAGAKIADNFLSQSKVPEGFRLKIRQCILATKMPQTPQNPLERIVCDADLYHLSTSDFFENNELLKKEAEALTGKSVSKEIWWENTISLMKNHHYHTDYCRRLLDDAKAKNLEILEKIKAQEKASK